MPDFWVTELLSTAWRHAAAPFFLTLAGLGTAALLTLSPGLAPRRPGPRILAATLLGWLLLGGLCRDTLHLLGDARLWLHSAGTLGLNTPGFREPLAGAVMMTLTTLTRDFWPPAAVLEALSVFCGVVTLLALWRYAGQGAAPVDLAARRIRYALLLYAAPLSLVFYGHVESYPLMVAGLALALPHFRSDLERGRPGWRTLLPLALLTGLHYSALLLVPPLALTFWPGTRGRLRRSLPLVLLALAVGGLLAAALPEAAKDATLAHRWTAGSFAHYIFDLANAWFLLLVPFLLFAPGGAVRRAVAGSPMGSFLILAALSFALLPLIGRFKLGAYRDLDLFAMAFLLLVFLVVEVDRAAPRSDTRGFSFYAVTGIPLLAALLALNFTPAGVIFFERRLATSGLDTTYRVYGYEALARTREERHDLPGARKAIEAALALVPSNTRLYARLGELTLAQGDTAQALTELARALQSNRAGDVRALMAGLELRRGHARAAVNLLAEDLPDVPAGAAASATLATAYYVLGRPDSTLWACDRRLSVAPDDGRAHANRAAALMALRQPVEALAELEEAAHLDPAPDIIRQRDRLRALLGGAGER